MTEISIRDARRVLLERQGLLKRAPFGRGKNAVLKAIDNLSYVQIDTISVVDRAHHHVLKSRVPNYRPAMLDRLLTNDRAVFEFWAHAAAYLPMADYRFYRPMMDGWRNEKKAGRDEKLIRDIKKRIREEGPLSSRHFEDPRGRQATGWWDWKPAKLALEHMFLGGEVMVSRREGFQKVYDLTENVLPADVETKKPGHKEWIRFIAQRNLRAAGIGTLHDISYARTALRRFTGRAVRNEIGQALEELVESDEATRVTIKEIDGESWYADPEALELLPIRLGRRQLHVLSPFDNAVINRERLARLFDFNYQIECYVPAPKREYGYFCLPLLYGDEFIGRVDAKANRKARKLEIRGLFFEADVKQSPALRQALDAALDNFAAKNDCDAVVYP